MRARLIGALLVFATYLLPLQAEWVDSAYEPKPEDGLIVQLNWVGHTLKDENGVDFSRFDPWELPLSLAYGSSFVQKSITPIDEIFAMSWAQDLGAEVNDSSAPFWIWAFWSKSNGLILDSEDKSLCYMPTGIGCLLPYAKHFKKGAIAQDKPSQSATKLHKLGKDDLVFPLSLTSDEKFYQVIIFPNAKRIMTSKYVEEAMKLAREITPINAFVQKSAIKSLPKGSPLVRFDRAYADVPVFFTPPKVIKVWQE